MTFPQTLTATEANKETPIGEMFRGVKWAGLFSDDPDATTGLVFALNGGPMLVDGVLTVIADQTTTLDASSTCYVEATRSGTISDNTTGFTAGRIPLYVVTTSASGVSSFVDWRTWQDLPGVAQRLSLSVAGGADVTLTAAQARNELLNFTGLLTANINVIVPVGPQVWTVTNNTTGAYTLTVKTSGGTGIAVTQTKALDLAADGTNVIATNTDSAGGGTGSVTSVAATVPAFLSVSGSPITTSGTLALSYSGTALPVANGGTGATTLAAHGVVVGNGTSAIAVTGAGTAGQVLTSNGASADPTFQTPSAGSATLTATQVGYGNGSNVLTGESTFTYDATYNMLTVTGAAVSALTGTMSSSSTTVTGTGTAFLTELAVGDKIYAAGLSRLVTAIASDTSLTTDSRFSPVLSGASATRSPVTLKIMQPSGVLGITINADGQINSHGTSTNSGYAFNSRSNNQTGGTLYSPTPNDIRIYDDEALRDVLFINAGDLAVPGTVSSGAVSGTNGALKLVGSTSGTATLTVPVAAGTPTITLPTVTSTLATLGANTYGGSQLAQSGSNGGIEVAAETTSTGTAAYGLVRSVNTAGWLGLQKIGTGYTPSGLVLAGQGLIYNSTGSMLTANAAASDMVWSIAGTAAVNEIMRLSSTGALALGLAGTLAGTTVYKNATSGSITITPPTGALGSITLTLPTTTGTLGINPMTTGGDVVYGGASGVPTRLANGSAGQVLTSAGTTAAPTWGAAGLTNPMTTGGDVIYGGASGVPTRLANGSAGQVLTSAGTTAAPTWTTVSGGSGISSAARAHATSTQSVSTGTNTAVTFNSETSPSFDSDSYHDTGSNTSRFTVPATGEYDAVATIFFAAAATGIRQIFWRVNGTDIYALVLQLADATNGNYMQSSLPALSLTAGDYLEIIVYQNSGGSVNIGHASTTYQQSVAYVRRVI